VTSLISYCAEVIAKVENRPGTWNSIRVGVFRSEAEKKEQVGEYVRNYPSLFETFCQFSKGGRDFALCSPDYTGTRIMELPSCKDIGGEERQAGGFCPVEYYVPTYGNCEGERVNEPNKKGLKDRLEVDAERSRNGPVYYHRFGFVAGCGWGDDSSWKIQYLDLSKAEVGIIKREARFGYIVLPGNLRLRDAIQLRYYNPEGKEDWEHRIRISVETAFDMRTGRVIDPLDM
jgi:hypothetical protein